MVAGPVQLGLFVRPLTAILSRESHETVTAVALQVESQNC